MIGYFNDPFSYSPKSEVLHKWFTNRWQVCSSLKIIPISRNRFLFQFPSREEAERINVGGWHWNGRRLSLEWWTPVAGTDLASKRSELRWIKAFGIPLHAWSLDTFKTIGEFCGGFVGVDEDTKHINHLLWARMCIRNTEAKTPGKINLDIGEWKFEISLVDEVFATPRFAGKFDQSCSSGAFPVAANVETSYP
ncbi:hypothetical protein A4A49_21436, partial [Nicotiana attenuata]